MYSLVLSITCQSSLCGVFIATFSTFTVTFRLNCYWWTFWFTARLYFSSRCGH